MEPLLEFFYFFIAILLIGIALFVFFSEDQLFECPLPNGGFFKATWNADTKQLNTFFWQPEKSKKAPSNVIRLQGAPVKKPKPIYDY